MSRQPSRFRPGGLSFGAVTRSLHLLDARQRRKYWWAVAAQLATSILDVLGVLLLGLVGVLAASAVSGQAVPDPVASALARVGLGGASPLQQALVLAAVAAAALLLKSLLFGVLAFRIFRFLGRCHASVAGKAAERFSRMPVWFVDERSSQEAGYAIYTGTQAAIVGVLGSFAIVAAETTLLVTIGATLLVLDPWIMLATGLLMGATAMIAQRRLSKKMGAVGLQLSGVAIETVRRIQEQVATFRELYVLDRQSSANAQVRSVIDSGARANAEGQFLVQVPKLVYESTLVVGAAIVVAGLTLTRSPEAAVGSLVLFVAAASRLVPSLLRATNQAVSMSQSAGLAEPAYSLITAMKAVEPLPRAEVVGETNPDEPFIPSIAVSGVTFRYPGRETPALEDVNLELEAGTHVALVGSSGAGKSTLVDIILGVQRPDVGEVRISGRTPAEALGKWRGKVAYVPQMVSLVDGSIRENVALGLSRAQVDDDLVWEALNSAHLKDFVLSHASGLETQIGERGVRMSGGQRQRLGLARGLYGSPSLIVMDEATSALDAETENLVAETLQSLSGLVTRVSVAHRLATVRSADRVVYLDRGRIAFVGTFDEVRRAVPDFDRQASLLGLH